MGKLLNCSNLQLPMYKKLGTSFVERQTPGTKYMLNKWSPPPFGEKLALLDTLQLSIREMSIRAVVFSLPPVLTISTAEDTALSGLVIPAAHLVDRGNYTCVASNSIGRSTLVISLHVQPAQAPSATHSLLSLSEGNTYIDLRVVKQTVHGILLEWFAVADTPEEKWFTLYIASDEALKKEVVHMGPGINTYAVDDLLPGTKYEACLSLGGQPPHQGQCVVFVTGRAQGGLEGRERLLHVTVVLCAVLLTVPLGAYVWAAQAPGSCREWGLHCCPLRRKALRCPHAVPQHRDGSCRDHIAVCEDGPGHRDAERDEENGGKKDSG